MGRQTDWSHWSSRMMSTVSYKSSCPPTPTPWIMSNSAQFHLFLSALHQVLALQNRGFRVKTWNWTPPPPYTLILIHNHNIKSNDSWRDSVLEGNAGRWCGCCLTTTTLPHAVQTCKPSGHTSDLELGSFRAVGCLKLFVTSVSLDVVLCWVNTLQV